MTDKEILSNSKRIIDIKKDVDTGDAAIPDIKDQVLEKFLDDCVNRARFVDSSLIISAVSKEFRNVFGVDAPNFEIKNDCRLLIDENENGELEDSEAIEIKEDPMRPESQKESATFIDSYAVLNAARFDYPLPLKNFKDDTADIPANKQKFFIDSRKAEESSGFHSPICPPGFDKWAGAKVYDKICKNYDFNEVALYKIFSNIPANTIPETFTMNFDGDDKFECNINEDGEITKNNFTYYLKADDKGNTGDSEQQLRKACSEGINVIPKGICVPKDEAPIKWYSLPIKVNSSRQGNKYYYSYSFKGTPFEKTETPIVKFVLKDSDGKEFSNGFLIMCPDPAQDMPSFGDSYKVIYNYKFCFNILYRNPKGGSLNVGENYDVHHKIWFIEWDTRTRRRYTATFTPLNSVPDECKKSIAIFIQNMLKDCLNYESLISQRMINNNIPDYTTSMQLMNNLNNEITRFIHPRRSARGSWDLVMDALEKRVIYDLTGKTTITADEKEKLLKSVTETKTTLEYEGEKDFIVEWVATTIIKWPKFLLRWFKSISNPRYEKFKKIHVVSKSIVKNFNNNYVRESSLGTDSYLGPKDGDLTRKIIFSSSQGNDMITLSKLVNEIMSDGDRECLVKEGKLKYKTSMLFKYPRVYTKIKVDKLGWLTINDTKKYEIVYDTKLEERPTYDKIQRATDLNWFMKNNTDLFAAAFQTLSSRIDKRTGTLRKTCNLLDSANINIQMLAQKKAELKSLYKYLNAFEITGGFGTKEALIQLTAWEGEDIGSIYSSLERMGTVYLLSDNTTLKTYKVPSISTNSIVSSMTNNLQIQKFEKNYIKTTITELIEQVSDTQYEYNLTGDNNAKTDKEYYVIDNVSGEYRLANEEEIIDENLYMLYERGSASSGPVFKVKLQHDIPKSFEGHNPRLVKAY